MAREAKFFLHIPPERVVGPHTLKMLRKWVYFEAIPRDAMVCEQGKEGWLKMSDVPGFLDFPTELQELWSSYEKQSWWSDPVTKKQLDKLDYFGLPYSLDGLATGRASQLIDCFTKIDPERAKQYRNRPATSKQKQKLRALGDDSGPELTYSEACDLIEDLELEKQAQDEDDEMDEGLEMMVLETSVNDEDYRELFGYKKLSQKQLKTLALYLKANPQFKDANTSQCAEIAMQLFPEIRKKSHARKEGLGRKKTHARKTGSGGCLILLIAGPIVWMFAHFGGSSSGPKAQPIVGRFESPPAQLSSKAQEKVAQQQERRAEQARAWEAREKEDREKEAHERERSAEWTRDRELAEYRQNPKAAQQKAVALYRDVGVADSPLNKEFIARMKRYQAEKKEFFAEPDWPIRLANECNQDVSSKRPAKP